MTATKRMTHNQRAKAIAAYHAAVDELVKAADQEAEAAITGKPGNPARLAIFTRKVKDAL